MASKSVEAEEESPSAFSGDDLISIFFDRLSKSQWLFFGVEWRPLFPFTLAVILREVDFVSDVILAFSFLSSNDTIYFAISLAIIIVSSSLCAYLSFKEDKEFGQDTKSSLLRATLSFLNVRPILDWYLTLKAASFKLHTNRSQILRYSASLTSENFIEATFESFPELILQSYILSVQIANTPTVTASFVSTYALSIFSIASSLFSVSLNLFSRFPSRVTNLHYSNKQSIFLFIFSGTVGRAALVSLSAIKFGPLVALIVAVHFVAPLFLQAVVECIPLLTHRNKSDHAQSPSRFTLLLKRSWIRFSNFCSMCFASCSRGTKKFVHRIQKRRNENSAISSIQVQSANPDASFSDIPAQSSARGNQVLPISSDINPRRSSASSSSAASSASSSLKSFLLFFKSIRLLSKKSFKMAFFRPLLFSPVTYHKHQRNIDRVADTCFFLVHILVELIVSAVCLSSVTPSTAFSSPFQSVTTSLSLLLLQCVILQIVEFPRQFFLLDLSKTMAMELHEKVKSLKETSPRVKISGEVDIDAVDEMSNTFIMHALKAKHQPTVDRLIEMNADLLHISSVTNDSVLMIAPENPSIKSALQQKVSAKRFMDHLGKYKAHHNMMEPVPLYHHAMAIQGLFVSSSNPNHVLTASFDKTAKLWDYESGTLLKTFRPTFKEVIQFLAMSKDESTIAMADMYSIHIFDAKTTKCVHVFEDVRRPEDLRLTADGSRLIAFCGYNVYVWDLKNSGRLLHTFDAHSDSVVSISLNKSEDALAVGCRDGSIKVYKLSGSASSAGEECVQTIQAHDSGCSLLSFCWSNRFDKEIIVSIDKWSEIKMWTVDGAAGSAECVKTIDASEKGYTHCIGDIITRDGTSIISCNGSNCIQVFDLETESVVQSMRTVPVHSDEHTIEFDDLMSNSRIRGIFYEPGSGFVYSSCLDFRVHGIVRKWNMRTGQCVAEKELTGFHERYATVIAVADNSGTVATAGNRELILWKDQKLAKRIVTAHNDDIRWLSFSQDGTRLVSSSRDRSLKLWNGITGQCISTFENSVAEIPTIPTIISKQGTHVVFPCVSKDRVMLTVWNIDIESFTFLIDPDAKAKDAAITSFAISGDGQVLIHGDNCGSIFIWKEFDLPEHSRPASSLSLQSNIAAPIVPWKSITSCFKDAPISALAISEDAHIIAAGAENGSIKLFDTETGELIRTLVGHVNTAIRRLQFSSDCRVLISLGGPLGPDACVKMWLVASPDPNPVRLFNPENSAAIQDAFISADGGTLLYTSDDSFTFTTLSSVEALAAYKQTLLESYYPIRY